MRAAVRAARALISLGVVAAAAASCATAAPAPATSVEIDALWAAFNAHDADAFAARVAEDVLVVYVDEEGGDYRVEGREQLHAELAAYFENYPDVRSDILSAVRDGERWALREEASWTADGIAKSQTSLSVYAFEHGLVTEAWYFPATK